MKNKKSMAIAMAAVSTLGATPIFANEVAPREVKEELDVALSEGKIVEALAYDKVFDTKFTETKKDDSIKKGLTILDVISDVEGEEKYLVSREKTIDDIRKSEGETRTEEQLKADLAKEIAQAKLDLEETINDIKNLLTLSFINEKGEKQALYTINKDESKEVQAEDNGETSNYYKLVLTNNEKNADEKTIIFKNIKVEEKAEEETVIPKTDKITLGDDASYRKLSKYAFEIGIAKNVKVETEEVDGNTLDINIYKNDEKKTLVGKLTIEGMKNFDEKKFTKLATNGDFVGHWAQDSIVDAMLDGKVDLAEKFNPQINITRAQFAKIACTMFMTSDEIDALAKKDEPFHDVSKADGWKYNYITALYNYETTSGIKVIQGNNDKFRPDDKITRQEVAVILAKMIKEQDLDAPINDVNGNPVFQKVTNDKFEDHKEIKDWADNAVYFLSNEKEARYDDRTDDTKAKYVSEGSNGKFNPANNITRAEALVMVERAAAAKELNKVQP